MIEYIEIDTQLDPVVMYKLIREQYDFTFLLESMEGPQKFVTQSVIGFDPLHRIRISKKQIFVDGQIMGKGLEEIKHKLDEILKMYEVNSVKTKQFVGGLVGFTSYDFIRYIEKLPDNNKEITYPDAMYGLYLDGIRFDHTNNTIHYFHHPSIESRKDQLDELFTRAVSKSEPFDVQNVAYTFPEEKFKQAIKIIKNGIISGETFQTVLSQRINFEIDGDHIHMYEQLREINPSPYMYYLEFNPYTIIGSSPELLLSVEQNVVTTYPIAGTRQLAETEEENHRLAQELLNDEKERAEHNMLVDLARNDVGKISEFNSVNVNEYMNVEYFSHVMHLVSKVQGQLKSDFNMFDAFYSAFPAGTVSGAPKIRSMELIDQLEPVRRGPYAGSVGYFSINQETVQAITIRTAFGINNYFSIQAGAGIVLDSIPKREYEETLHKLAALLEILEVK